MKNSIRFTPETKINASQVAKIKIVCPISGCEINNKIIGDDGNAMRKRKSANRKKTFGTIYSLNGNMDKESDKNKYDGGSGTMYEGRDD